MHDLYFRIVVIILHFSAPFCLGVAIWGPNIFSLFFGEQWHDSGVIARILVLPSWLGLAVQPLSYVPIFTGRLKWRMRWDVVRLLSLVIMMLIGMQLSDDPILIVVIHSLVTSLAYIVFVRKMFVFIRKAAA